MPWPAVGDCAHETVRDPGIVAGRSSRSGKLYQKEGVTWRLDADGERIPGFIEPLFAKEKEKNISRHILPICTDTMDMGCGWFLIKLLGN